MPQSNVQSSVMKLPRELLNLTDSYLTETDRSALALANKKIHGMFYGECRSFFSLLRHVAVGNQDIAERILTNKPELMFKKGSVLGYGRQFWNVTVVDIARRAYDIHMLRMLFKTCLSLNSEELLLQFDQEFGEFDKENNASKEITYQIYSNFQIKEAHYDWDIIPTLERFVTENPSKRMRSMYLSQQVIKCQKLVPPHVIHEYCSKSFQDVSRFNEEKLNRTCLIFNSGLYGSDAPIHWLTLLSNMSWHADNFILGGRSHPRVSNTAYVSWEMDRSTNSITSSTSGLIWNPYSDLLALKELRDIRKRNLIELKVDTRNSLQKTSNVNSGISSNTKKRN